MRHAGIEDVEWYARHAERTIWIRAPGLYTRTLGRPQLFIEGNHRTGALLMSYVLVREGQPPFVLSVDNAAAYFDLSAAIRDLAKTGPAMFVRQLVLRRRLAALLVGQAHLRYLLA